MDIRPFRTDDREACLTVFDSNTPDYFAPAERDGFARFLDAAASPYFAMEHDGKIAGCGGFSIVGNAATLSWGMIRRDLHRNGLGRFLLLYRLREITRSAPAVELVSLDTSQLAAPFFESQGFRIAGRTPDGYGPGLDRIAMVKRLIVCA